MRTFDKGRIVLFFCFAWCGLRKPCRICVDWLTICWETPFEFRTHRCHFGGLRGLQRGFQEAWVSLQLSLNPALTILAASRWSNRRSKQNGRGCMEFRDAHCLIYLECGDWTVLAEEYEQWKAIFISWAVGIYCALIFCHFLLERVSKFWVVKCIQ